MKSRFLMAMAVMLVPAFAMAKPHIVISTLQKAVYENPNCSEEGLEKGACLTECEVSYPVIDGIEAMAQQKALNAKFEKKALAARCEGKKFAVGVTEDFHVNNRSFTHKVLFNDGKLIGLSEDNYYYGSGAAHGIYSSNGIIVDARTGKELATNDILDISKLDALNEYITAQVKKDERVFDNIRNTPAKNIPAYISATNREFTLMLSEERGLYALFGIYQIGPYASGEIDYKIPTEFVKHPHIKHIIDTLELNNAQR